MANENWNDYFSRKITGALEASLESRYTLPWHMAAIGANGALIYSRYDPASDETLDCTFLSEHLQDTDGLKAPVNIVLVDINSEAIRIFVMPFSRN